MQATRRKQRSGFSQLLADFPRKHLVIASSALALMFVALLITPGHDVQASRSSQLLELAISSTPPPPPVAEVIEPEWQEFTVKEGDSLSTLFSRAGLSAQTLYQLLQSNRQAQDLKKIYPGQILAFAVDDQGQLEQLKYQKSRLESLLFTKVADSYDAELLVREPEPQQRFANATISSSLYRAAQQNGLDDNLIMELANVFGGVIDFVYDVRVGDHFNVMFEEFYLDGERIGTGAILAAQFTNRGETHTAYRYVHENGDVGYYTRDGVSMRKAFLRAPLDFTRISSSFNLKRLHPIFKTRRPHRGIDYAASTGTPVFAAGDGRIKIASYTKANGNYVIINHGTEYQTKYLHLHKRAVSNGQRVKQGQIIGWVGSTGYATGPHLHYEFLVNGVHRNPRTILQKLPKAKSLPDSEKQRFLAQIEPVYTQLATYNNQRQLALSDADNDNASL